MFPTAPAAAEIFRSLGDPTRLRILALLRAMELSVGELAQVLGQSQPRVSRHVRILIEAGLAERRKEGSWVFLSLADPIRVEPLFAALERWAELDGEDPWAAAELRQGDMYALPLAAGSADTVILHQVLHYAQQPAAAVAEAARLLAPGGRLLIVDFAPHEREELRSRDAHLRLGFADEAMLKYLDGAGLKGRVVEHLEGGELTVTLWQGERPLEKLKSVA